MKAGGAALLLALLGTLACEPPFVPDPPEERQRLHLLMALEAHRSVQGLQVSPAHEFFGIDSAETTIYRIEDSGSRVALATGRIDTAGFTTPCERMVLVPITPHLCLSHEFTPVQGGLYEVEVRAEGRPTATARTRMPGAFDITEVIARGDPPGTEQLRVSWTPSESAYGYMMGVHSQDAPRCIDASGCEDGWYRATRETGVDTGVPAWVFEQGPGPWHIVVLALSRELFEYLTTGSGGSLFSVPPVQNVENGYGVVGAMESDSRPLVGAR